MSELVDLVDSSGAIQVAGLPRAEACANRDPDLYVPIAVAVIFNGLDQVLLQQRSRRKMVDPGRLDFVCGIISSGELPEATAIREAEEETNVTPLNVQVIAQGVNAYKRYRYLIIGDTEANGPTIETPNEEVEWAQVMNMSIIPSLITDQGYQTVADFHSHLDAALLHSCGVSYELEPNAGTV